jgi:sporulation protein YlmC with PRC-barrel domain
MKTSAIAATLFAATAPLAFAYPGTQTAHAPGLQPTTVAFTLKSGELQASQLIGSTVYDVNNESVAKVKDVLLDRDGKVNTVVLDVGSIFGVGGKYVGVALNDIKMSNDRLTLDRSKQDLKSAAAFPYEQADETRSTTMPTRPTGTTAAPADTGSRSDTTNRSATPPCRTQNNHNACCRTVSRRPGDCSAISQRRRHARFNGRHDRVGRRRHPAGNPQPPSLHAMARTQLSGRVELVIYRPAYLLDRVHHLQRVAPQLGFRRDECADPDRRGGRPMG